MTESALCTCGRARRRSPPAPARSPVEGGLGQPDGTTVPMLVPADRPSTNLTLEMATEMDALPKRLAEIENSLKDKTLRSPSAPKELGNAVMLHGVRVRRVKPERSQPRTHPRASQGAPGDAGEPKVPKQNDPPQGEAQKQRAEISAQDVVGLADLKVKAGMHAQRAPACAWLQAPSPQKTSTQS